jgi:IclR family pca regulon transcriptional regulator
VAVPLRDRKGECKGAVGMTLQAPAYSAEAITERLLPLLNDAAQSLRPLL